MRWAKNFTCLLGSGLVAECSDRVCELKSASDLARYRSLNGLLRIGIRFGQFFCVPMEESIENDHHAVVAHGRSV